MENSRNTARNYDIAYYLLNDLDRIYNQQDTIRDEIDRREMNEEVEAKRKELSASMHALPIELIDFKLISINDKKALNWEVNNMVNFNRFEVEASTNGTTNSWKTLALIDFKVRRIASMRLLLRSARAAAAAASVRRNSCTLCMRRASMAVLPLLRTSTWTTTCMI